jgi:predicted hydrolase (HD superfamily)
MKAYAKKFGESEENWAIIGLLHDFDYERFPTAADHPWRGAEILKEKSVPQDWIDAILGHADYTGVPRSTRMAKTLYAVDELTGLIHAAALVRPSRKIADVEVKSIKKKMKDKAFAAAVNREDIMKGAEDLGVNLDDHISVVLIALQGIAEDIGL